MSDYDELWGLDPGGGYMFVASNELAEACSQLVGLCNTPAQLGLTMPEQAPEQVYAGV